MVQSNCELSLVRKKSLKLLQGHLLNMYTSMSVAIKRLIFNCVLH